MEKEFCLEEYISSRRGGRGHNIEGPEDEFRKICSIVGGEFEKEWKNTDENAKERKLEREKRAMMGYESETRFYKERINEITQNLNLSSGWFPPWYPNLTEGIFAELYGLAGLAPWAFDLIDKYKNSTSAKLIGDRLYCMIDGVAQLQPQRISERRREQLKRTMLLATPHERLEYGFHEVFLHNGIRITIYSGNRTKKDQDVFVLRKYVMKNLTLDEMAAKGTIPFDSIEFFKQMIGIGYNILISGQVRSGKTTFLQVWQSYEDKRLEGLAIATDPETMWHEIMPDAPIMQLVADGEELKQITKSLLRGDNDYVLIEEMRDAAAFSIALDITSTGTRRCKGTIHESSAINVPYKIASKISEETGGILRETVGQVYKNFDYCIEMCQYPGSRDRKIIKGIWQYSFDYEQDSCRLDQICKYDFIEERWKWKSNNLFGKEEKYPEDKSRIEKLQNQLKVLETASPLKSEPIFPGYYRRD